jgi:hypothetical protein
MVFDDDDYKSAIKDILEPLIPGTATTASSKIIPRTALDQKLDGFEKDFANY